MRKPAQNAARNMPAAAGLSQASPPTSNHRNELKGSVCQLSVISNKLLNVLAVVRGDNQIIRLMIPVNGMICAQI